MKKLLRCWLGFVLASVPCASGGTIQRDYIIKMLCERDYIIKMLCEKKELPGIGAVEKIIRCQPRYSGTTSYGIKQGDTIMFVRRSKDGFINMDDMLLRDMEEKPGSAYRLYCALEAIARDKHAAWKNLP